MLPTAFTRMVRTCLVGIMLALLPSLAVDSATVYRSLDVDGIVIYSDKPPASGKAQKTLNIVSGPASPLPDAVLKYQLDLDKSMKKRIAEGAAPQAGTSLLFVTKTCVYCKGAKAYLAEKRIPYQENDIETPDGMRAFAATGGGRSGVPVLVQNDRRQIGFSRQIYDAFFATLK